jgi:DNA ligase-1
MKFSALSKYLEKLEHTTSRNIMIEILADLFKKAPPEDIDKIVYLLQGRIAPLYSPLEFKMADKMMLKALAFAYVTSEREVNALYRRRGDLGEVAEELAKQHKGDSATVSQVFDNLKLLAETEGVGSVEKKIGVIAKILKSVDPLSARFIARIPVAKLRLGFSDMTVLDSLSWMINGSKAHRIEIEPVFNIRPDLGYIAKTVKQEGVKGLAKAEPTVFTPILMARAERLSSGEEIIKKIGKCAVEPKFDGFRLQVHKKGSNEKLFTRNLEEATFMYPDVVAAIQKQISAREAIFEGEAIAFNLETGEYLPFQETVQRKRKYGIEQKAKEIPLKLICFDLLFVNGRNLIDKQYVERRAELGKIIGHGDIVILSEEKMTGDAKEIENFFDDAVSRGLEGILAKKLDGKYQAGARGWNWIKFKRSYSAHLEDTIDCVVMGYNAGKGKRTAFGLGAFLIGVYDETNDVFVTIAKIGTGLTDDEWRELYKRAGKLKAHEKPPLYEVDKLLFPDVWIEPEIVVEIRADEITRSPIHTAGRRLKPSKSGEAFVVDVPGYALRFPRLEKFRDDKKPGDSTTLKEVEEMFEAQKHVRLNKSKSE